MMKKQTTQEFNAALTARLNAEGFTQQEQALGQITAECRAALQMLKVGGPRNTVPFMALSTTFAKLLSLVSEKMVVDGERIVAASTIIGEAAMARAEAMFMEDMKLPVGGASEQPESGDADCPVHAGLDATPAPHAKDIN